MRFLVLSSQAWQDVRQRPHHLMARFAAAGHQVLWLQPRYLRWLIGERRRFFRSRGADPAPRLRVRPVTLVNGERLPAVRAFNQARLSRAMLRQAPPAPPQTPTVLWIYNPHEGSLAGSVPHDKLIYDIMDEHHGFPWSPPRIIEEEAALLARADWVFAGTQALFDAKRPLAGGRIERVLSGVEPELFAPRPGQNAQAELAQADPAAADWARRHEFIIGYAGVLDLRFDAALVEALAAEFPRWGFMLLGPQKSPLARLAARPNVFAPGAVDYGLLPAYYRRWNAAWLPFVENELTRHINPTKMLEYAAARLPVAARALPDVRRFYAAGAWLFDTPAECRAILMELAASPAKRAERLDASAGWLAGRDWDSIARAMLARVEGLFKQP